MLRMRMNMEMYTRRNNNTLQSAYDHFAHAVDGMVALLRPALRAGGGRIKTEAEKQAENRKACYEARAMAGTWQGPRYFR